MLVREEERDDNEGGAASMQWAARYIEGKPCRQQRNAGRAQPERRQGGQTGFGVTQSWRTGSTQGAGWE